MGVLRVVLRGAETAASSSSNANGDFGAPPPPGTPLTEYCDLKYAGLWEGPIPDQGRQSLIIIWTLVALATVFTALRFYAKISRLNRLWWDDWVLLAAWVRSPPRVQLSDSNTMLISPGCFSGRWHLLAASRRPRSRQISLRR